MNQRRKAEATGPVGSAPKNTNTTMKSGRSQVSTIKNTVSPVKATGYTRVKNAVNG